MRIKLSPTQQKIYDLVSKRPRTVSELMASIWWVHPQDAPHRSVIKAQVWHLNQVIKNRGERIVGAHGCNQNLKGLELPYRLERGLPSVASRGTKELRRSGGSQPARIGFDPRSPNRD